MKPDKALVGAAGVHYVAFQLSSRGYAVGLTAPRVRDVDVLVTNVETGRSSNIQVKTMSDAHVDRDKGNERWKWRIGARLAGREPSDDFFFAFVDLRRARTTAPDESQSPDVFIVPSADLPFLLKQYPAKGPSTDYWVRIFKKDEPHYRNRWDIIEIELNQSPSRSD